MNHSVKHDLDVALVKKCVSKAGKAYAKKYANYHPTLEWVSDNVAKIGFAIGNNTLTGKLVVNPKSIDMELEVPFLFALFKKQAIKIIEDEIQIWLEKARRGEIRIITPAQQQ